VLAALLTPAAWADCEREGLVLFPAPGGVLPTNTHFILEGIGEQQVRVGALVGKRLVLKTNDDKAVDEVLVHIQRGWQSTRGRTAVRLTPYRALKPGRTYTLELERLLPRARLLNPAPGSGQALWRIGKEPDNDAPHWRQPPVPAEGEYERHGTDVTRWIYLRAALLEESPAFLVVSLRKRRSVETQTYFVPINGERARLGHDACSGSFALENRTSYQATVEAYDCTEKSAGPVPPVDVSSPAPVRP
jgi:hypothetical protein